MYVTLVTRVTHVKPPRENVIKPWRPRKRIADFLAHIKAMTGGGAMTLREVARRVDRDVKAVHGDVHTLLGAGVLRRNADGKIEFPFDAVHVDFVLKAACAFSLGG
jgi:predicted transcriptional regulator